MKINDILKKNYQIVKNLDLSRMDSDCDVNNSELLSAYECILNQVVKVYRLSLSKGIPNQLAEGISIELFKVLIQHTIKLIFVEGDQKNSCGSELE